LFRGHQGVLAVLAGNSRRHQDNESLIRSTFRQGLNLAVQLRLGEGPVLKEYPPLTVLT
jgi:hypothetical protein